MFGVGAGVLGMDRDRSLDEPLRLRTLRAGGRSVGSGHQNFTASHGIYIPRRF
jgi:hypothetical protein